MKIEDLEIIEDEIISIEEYKEIDTIDIEIDSKNKLFFANDILTHNSGWDVNDLTLSNISESAALLHTVDGLFGIVADPIMKSKGEYFLKYLADRVSGLENTRKKFNFNREYGRIEEDMTSQIEDMDLIALSIGGGIKTKKLDLMVSKSLDNPSQNQNNQSTPVQVKITGKELFSNDK
jgi:hypothetical protein